MAKPPSETEVKEALKIILADKASYKTSLNWAVNYCRNGLQLSGPALKTQVLYILSNITHWKHPQAPQVRFTLKKFSKS